MLIALLADIHGNREAFDACLDDAYTQGADHFAFLGDLVGYGADPSYIVDQAAQMVGEGALAILGNHDAAVDEGGYGMNEHARAAIDWTRAHLDREQRAFLKALPVQHRVKDVLYVHADASAPEEWHYVMSQREAEISLNATDATVTFCGHVHRPQLYTMAPRKLPCSFTPKGSVPIPLAGNRKWLAVMGAVGQPRDENPGAAYGLFDDAKKLLTFRRVPYDIETAAEKIRRAGLPAILSARLFIGR
ncbi:metallophosphoesterase family protein [Methylovirgula sp. 4M-Z18]|uniref:metallophosphoesterase family protein n=1 Tax=Methylovirgula sp. 4M-Z18 TaxID=2293567 RepID=UPI000E2F094F|nr:metallophosphoesterase family protein [Methylovirgula sp. 4M-Z18]RFB79680.1 metallophosphoesterase [Methylovirgula sp. 4M-Z18]